MEEKDHYVDHIYDEAIIEKYCKDVCIVQGLKTYVLNLEMLDIFYRIQICPKKLRIVFPKNMYYGSSRLQKYIRIFFLHLFFFIKPRFVNG